MSTIEHTTQPGDASSARAQGRTPATEVVGAGSVGARPVGVGPVDAVASVPLMRIGAHRSAPPRNVMALQRGAGNAAVARALAEVAVQRQAKAVRVGPVSLNNPRVSVPIPAGATLQGAVPAGQSVNWSLVAGTAAVDPGSTIDAAGVVTLAATQAGGRLSLRADDQGSSGAFNQREVFLIKPPGSVASTAQTGSAAGANYGANFRHTFAAAGGGAAAEMENGRVNELFVGIPTPMATSHAMVTPFGPFNLQTNDPASTTAGWGSTAPGG